MICPFFFLVFYVSAITTGARSCTGSTVFFLGRAGEGGAFELYGTIAVPARTVLPYRTWRWMDTALPLEEMIGRALRAELCLCVFVRVCVCLQSEWRRGWWSDHLWRKGDYFCFGLKGFLHSARYCTGTSMLHDTISHHSPSYDYSMIG